jgi:DNA ligase (NAD+)
MNIEGLGSETIALLYDKGLLHSIADIYDLRQEDLAAQERLGEKSAQNILQAIEASKQVPWARVLFALGIRMVGETTAKKIAKRFRSIDALQWASKEELTGIEDVGEQIAENIVGYFADIRNLEIITRLQAAGVQLEDVRSQISEVSLPQVLEGKTIVISGTFSFHSRDEYKQMIEDYGGKNSGSVSKKTDFILAGENMGQSKLEKAKSLGVRIVNEEEFLTMIHG